MEEVKSSNDGETSYQTICNQASHRERRSDAIRQRRRTRKTKEARETRARVRRGGVHEQQSRTSHYLLHARTSIHLRWLGGHACLAIAMRQATVVFALRHIDFTIGDMATMLCMCVRRGSGGMRRVYAQCMPIPRAGMPNVARQSMG